eukprot:GHUV01035359.1.p1 GENE.GHUV01035359.1~~GHUV01035359.1.p1  ORF type:complete len:129 (-),score=0.99 GHUV01035359.1:340-726(-)
MVASFPPNSSLRHPTKQTHSSLPIHISYTPYARSFNVLLHKTSCGKRAATCCPHGRLQYLGDLGADFVVFKNDEKTVDEIRAMNPAGVLVSPGPGGRTGFAVVGVQRMWLCSLQWGVAVGTMVVVTLL